MKIISWNVAGFRACLKKGFEDFFYNIDADIYCLQEVKALQEQIDFNPKDYYCYLNPADKKGYSGTMIYTCYEPLNVTYGIGIDEHDHEGRVITLEYKDFYLVNQYVPNVKRDLSRLDYRMKWEEDIKNYLKQLEKKKPVIICGDFNVAHTEMDIKNAKANRGNAGFTDEEREKFTTLLDSGFIDTYRYYNKDQKDAYTWWSYMGHARENNIGWRIDYFLVSKSIINKVKNPTIHKDVYGSDHCPISINIELN
ncbi:MAG: exodeoxyribonuclease III [Bacilli bacterium]|nr:exodeoxyribonuclease III [Bacilli bacterium]